LFPPNSLTKATDEEPLTPPNPPIFKIEVTPPMKIHPSWLVLAEVSSDGKSTEHSPISRDSENSISQSHQIKSSGTKKGTLNTKKGMIKLHPLQKQQKYSLPSKTKPTSSKPPLYTPKSKVLIHLKKSPH
jgi:hypothetical protein